MLGSLPAFVDRFKLQPIKLLSLIQRANPPLTSKCFNNTPFRPHKTFNFPSCRFSSFSENVTQASKPQVGVEEIMAKGVQLEHTSVEIGRSSLMAPLGMYKMRMGDHAFFVLLFIACTTSIAFISLVIAAIPTLFAMKRAASSLAKLADTAREELPGTMAAVRLSGMEISDLTLELNDLSQEIADGVSKSAQAVQAAEAGIRQIGARARQQTISMIQERANLPNISLRLMVAGAARKTSNAMGRVKNKFMSLLSGGVQDVEEEISREVEY
ncbi:hypothetical protein AXF42_Ash008480 [Apostasia shenzhenica]|uniref:Uncharacterized protein n=1 Tax=Apostasia shenzhenica TaxID=1088818 RepID=A0A2I0AY00_9ASPA|nr:hypothetical protein AXF42_Ash008480 [Apostasia shenzhenica]